MFGEYECLWLPEPNDRSYLIPFAAPQTDVYGFRLERYKLIEFGDIRKVARSPEVTWDYLALRGLFSTHHGNWPIPRTLIYALTKHEVSGTSRSEAIYDVYWMGLLYSKEFRSWIEEQYPTYWASIKSLFDSE
jgi:hypothetical protein